MVAIAKKKKLESKQEPSRGLRKPGRKKIVTTVLVVVLLLLVIIMGYTWMRRPLEVYEIGIFAWVSSTEPLGVSVDTDRLHFGRLPPGGVASRKIVIENIQNFPIEYRIAPVPSLATKHLVYEPTHIVLPGQKKEVNFDFVVEDLSDGNYTGDIRIELRKA